MILDITLLGVQMPTLLPVFFVTALFMILLDRIMADLGVYRYVWHPGLFRTAIFVCLFTIPCIAIYR